VTVHGALRAIDDDAQDGTLIKTTERSLSITLRRKDFGAEPSPRRSKLSLGTGEFAELRQHRAAHGPRRIRSWRAVRS
jgi:hypothetical protein